MAAAGPSRLLVVDDHQDSALSLARVLRRWGHSVRVAHDGTAAIEEIAANPFDLVLLDIGLPGMDGYQVASTIRERAAAPRPVLIALTGYGQEQDQRKALSAGFDLHMVKPVDLDELREILDRLDSAPGRERGTVAGQG